MRRVVALLLPLVVCAQAVLAGELPVKHVVLISFDGLRSDMAQILSKKNNGGFRQVLKEGVWTLNARTDTDYTVTLPNHTCMITGRPVLGQDGHGVIDNGMLDKTVHDYAGHYVQSVFDVVREHHLTSAMLASKPKFEVYQRSFPIDAVSITNYDDKKTLESFEKLTVKGLPSFVFMHFAGLDQVGHRKGWDVLRGSAYFTEAQAMDGRLKRVLEAISRKPALANQTIVIITADHGGESHGHGDKKTPLNYTIPFIIWGKAVAKGSDLYKINIDTRLDPLKARIGMDNISQPIRNGDAANLALFLLGLPSIEGSVIAVNKPLKIKKD